MLHSLSVPPTPLSLDLPGGSGFVSVCSYAQDAPMKESWALEKAGGGLQDSHGFPEIVCDLPHSQMSPRRAESVAESPQKHLCLAQP